MNTYIIQYFSVRARTQPIGLRYWTAVPTGVRVQWTAVTSAEERKKNRVNGLDREMPDYTLAEKRRERRTAKRHRSLDVTGNRRTSLWSESE